MKTAKQIYDEFTAIESKKDRWQYLIDNKDEKHFPKLSDSEGSLDIFFTPWNSHSTPYEWLEYSKLPEIIGLKLTD